MPFRPGHLHSPRIPEGLGGIEPSFDDVYSGVFMEIASSGSIASGCGFEKPSTSNQTVIFNGEWDQHLRRISRDARIEAELEEAREQRERIKLRRKKAAQNEFLYENRKARECLERVQRQHRAKQQTKRREEAQKEKRALLQQQIEVMVKSGPYLCLKQDGSDKLFFVSQGKFVESDILASQFIRSGKTLGEFMLGIK